MPTSSAPVIASVWTPYGLQDDPFFQMPLEPTEESSARRPTSLHVGRAHELTTILSRIVSDSNSRSLIHGDAGVGKTSFISKLKTMLSDHRVLMHEEPVRVTASMTPRLFLAEVLKVLLQIHATEVSAAGWLDTRVRTPRAEQTFWARLGRVINGEDAAAGGATAGLIGGQYEPIRIQGEVADLSLFGELRQAVEYLARGGRRQVLVHVNNLESLGGADLAPAALLMRQVRDAFLQPHSHWLFVGTSDIESGIFRAHSQVSSIIPPSTCLGPLTPAEVGEMMRRRYKHLQRGQRFVEPLPADEAGRLYARYRGDLRGFLTLAGEGVRQHALSRPGIPASADAVVGLMAPHHWQHSVCARISEKDARNFRAAMAGEPHDLEFHAAELQRRIAGMTQPTAGAFLKRLAGAGLVRHTRTQGRSVYFRVADGDVAVGLGMR